MDELDQLHEATQSLLDKAKKGSITDQAAAVDKAAGALRLSYDLEKSKAEIQKIALEARKLQRENESAAKRERSDRIKDYVSILTPLISVVALAATLLFQSWQFRQSEADKREAADDARWEAAFKSISESNKIPTAIVALKPFLDSPKYSDRAKTAVVQLLARSTDQAFFNNLFNQAFVPLHWNNLGYVVDLNRSIGSQAGPLLDKSYNSEREAVDTKKLSPEEQDIVSYADLAVDMLSQQVGILLQTPHPAMLNLDFSATYFKESDWHGANLSGANIEGAAFEGMDLRDANLEKITRFDGSQFPNTAWWTARSVSPELRAYLQQQFPYKPKLKWGPKRLTISPEEYQSALARLEGNQQQSQSPR